jgi:hypothetical protein
MHRPSGCAIAFGTFAARAVMLSIATRCIAMLYRATRPRESSVNQVRIVHIAMLSGSYARLVLSEMRQGSALKELGSARQTGRAPVSV